MFRTLSLLTGKRDGVTKTPRASTQKPADQAISPSPSAAATKTCLLLERLPSELRVRIYDFLVLFPRQLVPQAAAKSTNSDTNRFSRAKRRGGSTNVGKLVDTNIFLLNRQIYEESADLFYGHNTFCVPYECLCTCWTSKNKAILNEQRIKHLKVQDVEFEEPTFYQQCKMCHSDGYGLVKHLNALPNLRSAVVVFPDVESFGSCGRSIMNRIHRLGKTASIEATEVGRFQTIDTKALIELRMPALIRCFPASISKWTAGMALEDYVIESDDLDFDEDGPTLGEVHLYAAVRDILYIAIALGKTTLELKHFMDKVMSSGKIRFDSLTAKEHAEFSITLAEYLSDVIDDDDGPIDLDRSNLVNLSTETVRGHAHADTDA